MRPMQTGLFRKISFLKTDSMTGPLPMHEVVFLKLLDADRSAEDKALDLYSFRGRIL